MNANTKANSSASPWRHAGRATLAAALGGVVVLGVVFGSGFWIRDGSDHPPGQVEAVAAPAPSSVDIISHPSAHYVRHTIYIVGSDEQAAVLSARLNEADAIRANVSEPPLLDEVVVANSDEEAADIATAANELNRIITTQFVPETVVVDLRTAAAD